MEMDLERRISVSITTNTRVRLTCHHVSERERDTAGHVDC